MRGAWSKHWLAGWLLNALCLSCAFAREDTPPATVNVASEVWAGHSNADGTGLAWDVLRAVFEPAGVRVVISSEPYTRAIGLAQRGKVDAVLGLFAHEVNGVNYPRQAYADDEVVALGLAGRPAPTLATLADYRFIWVRGYAYQGQIANLVHFQEVQRRGGIAQMLKQDRADFYIDDEEEIRSVLAAVERPQDFQQVHLQFLPLYLGFAQTEQGRAMLALYEQRMDKLISAGTLRPLFARYQQHYPYDTPQEVPHVHP